MALLEREGPLASLGLVRDEAAAGHGSVVLVTGEPGIGKTALVTRFASDHRADTRLLWGNCDDLSIPRPLGPFRDLAVSGALREALDAEAPPHRLHTLLLAELAAQPPPTALVIEDVHWADEATVDAITVIGRRIGDLPAVLVLTYRSGELGTGHPLPAALEAVSGSTSLYLQLAPLSRAAVAELAGDDADGVYAASGGNPFYVTELIAARPERLPPSVANAVLGRVARLSPEALRLVELVAMAPSRLPTRVLDVAMPGWAAAAEEPERRQLLSVAATHVRFRHELAREAVRASVPAARRRLLHADLLRSLVATRAEPAEVLHHAEESGDAEAVAEHALPAARRAAAAESNREAYAHYARALDFAAALAPAERAVLYEEAALAAYTVDRLTEAFAAVEAAIALYREVGDVQAVGRCTRFLSRCHWYGGDGVAAREAALVAISVLEPLGESVELARAYSGLSQLAMLAGDDAQAVAWGEKSAALAQRLGADAVTAHALVNIGSVRVGVDPEDYGLLLEAHRLADAAGDRHEAVRALLNLGYSTLAWARPGTAWRYTRQAAAYAEEHQVDTLLLYTRVMLGWLHLRQGDWDEAEGIASDVAGEGANVAQLLADTVLAELAVRRGDEDAGTRVAVLAERAERAAELQRIGPVLQLEVEMALTGRADPPRARVAAAEELMSSGGGGWAWAGVAAWSAVAGLDLPVEGDLPEPFAPMVARDWRRAAEAFGTIGWDYDRALMLTLTDEAAALGEALETARRLGARPLEERATRRLRELGAAVPARPRSETLANPGGLTSRQLEVVSLVAEGLTNKEIARRLGLSVRTVEHHVEGVLAKLGAASRRAAARRYAELVPEELRPRPPRPRSA